MHDPVPFLRKPSGPKPRRRPRILRWILPVLIVGGVLTWGYTPTSTGPASGSKLNGSAIRATTRPTLRVATFNIHSGRNEKGEFNLDRTASVLKKDFDIIALNEVRGGGSLGGLDQAQQLGEKLSMQSLFAPTEKKWFRDDFGNGLLSSISVIDWKRTPLPGSFGRGKRNLLHVRVMLGGTSVNVFMTHIDRGDDRDVQLQQVFNQFLILPRPALLMGDLNTSANEPIMEAMLLSRTDVEAPVHRILGEKFPAETIDWILTRGFEAVSAGIDKNDASDHPLVWAELKLPDKK